MPDPPMRNATKSEYERYFNTANFGRTYASLLALMLKCCHRLFRKLAIFKPSLFPVMLCQTARASTITACA